LRPLIFFPRVEAAFAAPLAGLNRLAVEHGRGRLLVPALGVAQVGAQGVVDPLPGPVGLPAAEVAVDGLPGGEVVRQHSPGAAGGQEVEDGVEQVPVGVLPGPAAGLGAGDQVFDVGPLEVGQVRRVALPFAHADSVQGPPTRRKGTFSTPS
jgi:hypothetical protein